MSLASFVSRANARLHPLRGIGLRGLLAAAARLSSAAVVAQLLAIAASPVLLRLYTPEAFGVYLALTIVTSLGSTLATWRFELAVQSPRSFRRAVALVAAAAAAAVLTSAAAWCVFWLVAVEFGRFFGIHDAQSFSYFVPVMLLSTAAIEILRFLLWRQKAFGFTAAAIVIAAGTTILTQFALGMTGLASHGLLVGACMGQVVAASYLLAAAAKYRLPRASLLSLRTIASVAGEYRAFPLVTMPAGFAHMIAMQAPSAAIGALFGPSTGGLYYLASRLISAPVNVLSSSVYPTFVSAVTEVDRTQPGKLASLHLAFVSALLLVMSPLLALFAVGPEIFAFAFGEQWRHAGRFAAWIALAETVHLAATTTSALNVLRLNYLHAIWVLTAILIVGGVIVLVAWSSASQDQAVTAISIGTAFAYGLLILLNAYALARRSRSAGR